MTFPSLDRTASVWKRLLIGFAEEHVLDGSGRVLISPDADTGARKSWHSAKSTCEQADVVTVSGNTTVLAALP